MRNDCAQHVVLQKKDSIYMYYVLIQRALGRQFMLLIGRAKWKKMEMNKATIAYKAAMYILAKPDYLHRPSLFPTKYIGVGFQSKGFS